MAAVFGEPDPISFPVAFGKGIDASVQNLNESVVSDCTSKYLPVLFPTVSGVINIFPPPGPISPYWQESPMNSHMPFRLGVGAEAKLACAEATPKSRMMESANPSFRTVMRSLKG